MTSTEANRRSSRGGRRLVWGVLPLLLSVMAWGGRWFWWLGLLAHGRLQLLAWGLILLGLVPFARSDRRNLAGGLGLAIVLVNAPAFLCFFIDEPATGKRASLAFAGRRGHRSPKRSMPAERHLFR